MYAPGRSKMIRCVHLTRTLWQDLLLLQLHVGVDMVRQMLDQHHLRMRARPCISGETICSRTWQPLHPMSVSFASRAKMCTNLFRSRYNPKSSAYPSQLQSDVFQLIRRSHSYVVDGFHHHRIWQEGEVSHFSQRLLLPWTCRSARMGGSGCARGREARG